MGQLKLNKTEVERRVKESVEHHGGTFLYINWKKRVAHFVSPNGVKFAKPLFLGKI